MAIYLAATAAIQACSEHGRITTSDMLMSLLLSIYAATVNNNRLHTVSGLQTNMSANNYKYRVQMQSIYNSLTPSQLHNYASVCGLRLNLLKMLHID